MIPDPAMWPSTVVDGPETAVLACGAGLLGTGALWIALRSVGATDERATRLYALAALIPAIALASYVAMATGVGVVAVPIGGRGPVELRWARYADWLFTTPLLLLVLGVLVDADRNALFGAVAADAFMIATGLVATLSTVPVYRYVWWAVSTLTFLLVLYFVFVVLTAEARALGTETASAFVVFRTLTGVLWTAYPVWWLLGPRGLAAVTPVVETAGFVLLDVATKAGIGLLLLRSRAVGDGTATTKSDGRPVATE
jgi:bacteriorhodopsin